MQGTTTSHDHVNGRGPVVTPVSATLPQRTYQTAQIMISHLHIYASDSLCGGKMLFHIMRWGKKERQAASKRHSSKNGKWQHRQAGQAEVRIGAVADRIPVDTVTATANLKRPRHIKSHLPLPLLPRQLWTVKPKIVYVTRNPKDVAASYLHHYRMIMGYRGTKEAFLDGLLEDRVMYCPQVRQTLDFWALKDQPNVLFLTYEAMKRDLRSVLPSVCEFFGKSYTDAQLDELAEHLSFDQMKKNPATNNDQIVRNAMRMNGREGEHFEFMRKGIIGDYKNELSEEYIAKFDRFIEEQLAGSDFRYGA
ncbi:luciferin sulfotransferase-like isoform X2 [Anopheles darlingi]|uniref:luciferin sulfotransferase-like isoform X2 n=1 Tax=Anopheles darlingi TaxID=43151 RepID=UPI002100258B|nr:luciferin sulfotransferase-like isoform X2 [Anopheles darlingi]